MNERTNSRAFANEVILSSTLVVYVRLFAQLRKSAKKLLKRFSRSLMETGKVARGPRKKRLDFGENPDHVEMG